METIWAMQVTSSPIRDRTAVSLQIKDEATLANCAQTLHEARFTSEELSYDRDLLEFRLSIWQESPGDIRYQPLWRWFYRKIEPYRKYILTFKCIKNCDIRTEEKHSYYTLGTIKYSAVHKRIELVTHYAMTIDLTADFITGTLSRTDELRFDWSNRWFKMSFRNLREEKGK